MICVTSITDDDDIQNYAVNHCYCYSLLDSVLRLLLLLSKKNTTRRGLLVGEHMLGEQLVDLSDARPASERSAMESLHLRQHLGSHMNRCQNQNPHQPTNGLHDEQIDSSNGPNFSLTFSFCITFSFIFLCRR